MKNVTLGGRGRLCSVLFEYGPKEINSDREKDTNTEDQRE